MVVRKSSRLFAFIALGAAFASAPASAGLIGPTLGWQIYGGGGAYNPGGTGVQTNGSFSLNGDGVGGTFIDQGQMGGEPVTVFNIDVTDTTITFDYLLTEATSPWSGSPLSLSPTIYTGIAINLLSAGTFLAVSIDPATNMAGFGTSDLSFTGSQIQVNFADLPFSTATVVTLDVTTSGTGSGVPEPGTFFLLLTAGALLFRRAASSRAAAGNATE
jgi:hypothetical protein